MPTTYPDIGTVSHGTLLDEDLVETFGDLLATLDTENAHTELRQRARFWCIYDAETDNAQDDRGETVANLFLALEEFAPPYCYFGAIEGDGSDFGFWISWDSIEDATHDGDLLRVNDLAQVPNGYAGDVAVTNDHGNLSVGHVRNGEYRRYWDCV